MIGRPARPSTAIVLLLAAMAGGAIFAGEAPQPAPSKIAALPSRTIAATSIGVNLSGLEYWNREQVFANMVVHSRWFSSYGLGWNEIGKEQLDQNGWISHLKLRQVAPLQLILPPEPFTTLAVRCTYAGEGRLTAGGIATIRRQQTGALDLLLTATGAPDQYAWITIEETNHRNPLRNIDCRDASLAPDLLFHPAFIASLKSFAAVRFLDWQRTNDNRGGDWSRRTTPESASQLGDDGAALEHMVRLANEADVDPWFLMPYNADSTYIERFARYVHAHLEPGRTAYVELGNEVWNDQFRAAQQARREGVAAGLAPANDPFRAQLRRYAQKSRAALQIWTQVFAKQPERLVRVVSTLNAFPDSSEMVLGYGDTAQFVDALATAPYIHLEMAGRTADNVDSVFSEIDKAIEETIRFAVAHKLIAERYGKRFIAYEGGQHLVTSDMNLANRVQRDPRMGEAYTRYLNAWKARVGDRLMLYASTGPIGRWGAWGLREYAGQPSNQAPKLEAVLNFVGHGR